MNEVHKLRRDDGSQIPGASALPTQDLVSSVASRICHDLVSPLGAIANGLELLQLSGLEPLPEMALLEESVASAKARVKFFRLAFGAAGCQHVGRAEILDILATVSKGSRITYDWAVDGDPPRGSVKAAFLAIQCLETALPLGGRICVEMEGTVWTLSAQSLRLRVNQGHWDSLAIGSPDTVDAANLVQFVLLPQAVLDLGRTVTVALQPDKLVCRF